MLTEKEINEKRNDLLELLDETLARKKRRVLQESSDDILIQNVDKCGFDLDKTIEDWTAKAGYKLFTVDASTITNKIFELLKDSLSEKIVLYIKNIGYDKDDEPSRLYEELRRIIKDRVYPDMFRYNVSNIALTISTTTSEKSFIDMGLRSVMCHGINFAK